MQRTETNSVLNQLLVILHRSLPMYLSHAAPWVAYGDEQAQRVLEHLAADHKEYAQRLLNLLNDRRYPIELGEFPMTFTGLHDVSLDFLAKHLIANQKADLKRFEALIGRLAGDPDAKAIAQEVSANAQRHLEALKAIKWEPAGAKGEAQSTK